MFEPIASADIEWTEAGLPRSRHYGDVYFSDFGGLDETRHVFLAGNELAARMATAKRFTVGETGFGSGLNFLALWQVWRQVAPEGARLHFFSAEKHPVDAADMARIHALFPEIADLAHALRQNLPMPVPGYHRLLLDGGRVTVTLMYGDALAMLREQDAAADAWFLDGFAPRLNADLWTVELAQEIRRLSAKGATVATFSTSSSVMDALTEAGFTVEKHTGFGRKKHMLRGRLADGEWQPHTQTLGGEVAIAGAGLAGAQMAYALAMRGFTPVVHEKANQAAAGTSANPCAVFYPGVAVNWQPATTFYYMGFSHSRKLLDRLSEKQAITQDSCGMMLFPKPSDKPGHFGKVMAGMRPHGEVFQHVPAEEMPARIGLNVEREGVFFPHGGWVEVKDYVRALLNHPSITLKTDVAPFRPAQGGVSIICDGGWSGTRAEGLAQHIHPVQGQLTFVPEAAQLSGLRTVLSYGGYIAPMKQGYWLGATFERDGIGAPADVQKAAKDNLAKLDWLLDAPSGVDASQAHGWVGVRSVSRDRMPIVGQYGEDVYVSIAHASRGLLSCGIAAEYIASQLAGEPSPLPRSLARMISPMRFSGEF